MTEPTDNLQQRCAEIVEWQRTGVLSGSTLRDHAKTHWAGYHDSLQMAERDTFTKAVEWVAKWGTSPAVAGEPVAWRYRPSAVWDDYVLTDDPGKAARARGNGLHVEALCLTTPQPTQAQAGAVPLTCEWTHNDDDGFWETACGEAWRFDDGGPAENSMHFCHSCGKSLRIKGKEPGNADA